MDNEVGFCEARLTELFLVKEGKSMLYLDKK